jgi:hypothetical protein
MRWRGWRPRPSRQVRGADSGGAWTTARSPAVHPILGARRVDQLLDNLGSLEIQLAGDTVKRLESAAGFDIGFPSSFISEASDWVFGAAQAS